MGANQWEGHPGWADPVPGLTVTRKRGRGALQAPYTVLTEFCRCMCACVCARGHRPVVTQQHWHAPKHTTSTFVAEYGLHKHRAVWLQEQGSKVPVPNQRLVPGSREKRGKTGENGEKRENRGKTGGKRRKNGEKTGENGGKSGGGGFGQDPPTRLLPPPPFIFLWGAFFANQIEAKALSRVRHPSPKG